MSSTMQARLGIKGMTCATCSGAIERLLRPIEGIKTATVSLLMNEAVVEFDANKITIDDIIEEIEDIGFDAHLSAIKEKANKSQTESIPSPHKTNKKHIVIWSSNIEQKDEINEKYLYHKTKHLVGINKIILNEQNDNLLSIYFDKLSILPMAITHCLQSEGIILNHITLSHAFPEVHREHVRTEEKELKKQFSELKKLTFSLADPLEKYHLFAKEGSNDANALDFNLISLELGEIIESVNSKKVTKTDKKTKTKTDRLQVIIEYYDIEHDGIRSSTGREIYEYLINTMSISENDVFIIDAMSAERDEFRATQIAIVSKIEKQFYISCCFGVPIFFIAMIFPYIPGLHELLMYDVIPGNESVDISALLLFILSIPVQFYVGRTFYISCLRAAKHKTSNMSTLIALGTSVAWIYSFIALLLGLFVTDDKSLKGGTHFFETSTTVITIVLLGKWLQAKAKFKTCDAIGMLMDLSSSFAVLVNTNEYGEMIAFNEESVDEMEKEISTELVVKGDILKIDRGSRVPVDGTIVYGWSAMDERMITGESIPRDVTVGDHVISSSINCGDDMILIRVDKSKQDSAISKIIELMKSSQTNKPKQQEFADIVSSYFVPIVVSIAVLTFVVWYSLCVTHTLPPSYNTGDCALFSLLFSMAVMVIACPCALGLATPTAVMVGMGVAAKYGCLIKGGDVLEVAHSLDIIVFDKTGTLTYGKPKVVDFVMFSKTQNEKKYVKSCCGNDNDKVEENEEAIGDTGLSKTDSIYFAGCCELNSEHPLGKAIVAYAQDKLRDIAANKELITPMEFEAVAGKGIKANINGCMVHIGNLKWFFGDDNENKLNIKLPSNISSINQIKRILKRKNDVGNISLLLAVDNALIAYICLFDAPRPETRDVIHLLQTKYKKKCVMLTGDNHNTAVAVANAVGINEENVISRVLPQDKHRVIKQLQCGTLNLNSKERHIEMVEMNGNTDTNEDCVYKFKVAMVGDGINDAAALTQSNLGIAIGNGTDIAIEASDVILMNDNLWNIAMLIDLSSVIIHRIYLNFVWALGFNSLGIPIAAGVFYPFFKIRLPPQLAAVAMGLSSLCVLVSSMLLKTYRSPYSKKTAFKMEMKADAVAKLSVANQKACGCGLNCACQHDHLGETLLQSVPENTVGNKLKMYDPEQETLNPITGHAYDCCCDECNCVEDAERGRISSDNTE